MPQTEEDPDFWEDPDTLLYAYIWLGILSAILLIFLLVICLLCSRVRRLKRDYARLKKSDAYTPNAFDNDLQRRTGVLEEKQRTLETRQRELEANQPPEWVGTMKPDQDIEYEVSTIERQASNRNKNLTRDDVMSY